MKINRNTQTATAYIFFAITFFMSCTKDSVLTPAATLQNYTGNLHIELQSQSIEEVFSAQMPWESRALNYYNVLKTDSSWSMFYKSYAYNQLEFDGAFCVAQSSDGKSWDRPTIDNNTNILINGVNEDGITGNYVFIDDADANYRYKMICIKLINGNQKTFLYGSKNGLQWKQIKMLFNQMQDSQFSMIRIHDTYYLFLRYNDYSKGYQRAIGLAVLDKNLNIIKQPKLLLEADINDKFSHIYNNAASHINDSTVLLFPTYYDDVDGAIQIKIVYTNNMKDYYLVNNDINTILFPNGNVNWAIVAPGLFPTGEANTYWLYYYQTNVKHNSIPFVANINVRYFRIKLKVY